MGGAECHVGVCFLQCAGCRDFPVQIRVIVLEEDPGASLWDTSGSRGAVPGLQEEVSGSLGAPSPQPLWAHVDGF